MADQIDLLLPRLRTHQIPGLALEGEFLLPNYAGYSLLNLPESMCQAFGLPSLGVQPLAPEYLDELLPGIQRVLILVVDGLGLLRFRQILENRKTIWSTRLGDARLSPLTSVSPSTTSAALTTLWTGASPAQHSILGYELWLKEYGVVANMISHGVMSAPSDAGGLARSGFQPEIFLQVPRFGTHLENHGVRPYSFMPAQFVHSGLSTMHLAKVETIPYRTPVDLAVTLIDFLERKANERLYAYLYWEPLDTLAHIYGPEDPRIEAEFTQFSQVFEEYFINQLSPELKKGTLLILTADHGFIHTPHNPIYEIRNHPELASRLHIYPTGENRLAYLYIKPGMSDAVAEIVEGSWPGEFSLIPSMDALQAGLFGPGDPDPRTPSRIGDMICLAHGQSYIWWSAKENRMLGRHGGLSPTEMLVPLYALRLD